MGIAIIENLQRRCRRVAVQLRAASSYFIAL
jgi:hypothetical protein